MSDAYSYNPPLPSEDYRNRTAWIESRGDPNARTGNSQYRGLHQLGNDQIGDNWKDPKAQNAGLDKVYGRDYAQLSSALGRPPTDAEMYSAHNMGVRGFLTRLNNPNAPVTDTPGLPASHAESNPFGFKKADLPNVTNAQYLQKVQGVWDSAGSYTQGYQAGVAPAQAQTQVASAQPAPQGPNPAPSITDVLAKLKGGGNNNSAAGPLMSLIASGATPTPANPNGPTVAPGLNASSLIGMLGKGGGSGGGSSPGAALGSAAGSLLQAGSTPVQAPKGPDLTPQELAAMTAPLRRVRPTATFAQDAPLNIPKLIGQQGPQGT